MAKKAHKSPAKARYDATHPIISTRVPKTLYNELADVQHSTKQSLRKLLEVALGKASTATGNAYKQGHDDGLAEAGNAYEQGHDDGEKDTIEAIKHTSFTAQCPECRFSFDFDLRNLEKED